MQFKLRQVRNSVSPSLLKAARGIKDRRPLLEGVALASVQLTKRAFNEAGLRPKAWPPLKKSGQPARLRQSNTLARSPRVTTLTNRKALIGSDRRYAAIHQLGGVSRPMPARPFFPFYASGRPTPQLVRNAEAVLNARIR